MEFNLQTSPKMKINLTSSALEFLEKAQKREIYIENQAITQCCIPLTAPPSVRKGGPRQPKDFYLFEVDGITVYYDQNLIQKAEITVDTQGFGVFKGLIVTDWVIKY